MYGNHHDCGCGHGHRTETNNYHSRPIYQNNHHGNCCHAVPNQIHHHNCGCMPTSACGCNSSYGETGCGCGSSGSASFTGTVAANSIDGTYTIAAQMPPGTYMVTQVDNVSGGEINAAAIQIAKTIGTQFTLTVPTDMKWVINTVNSAPTVIRFTRL